VAVAFYLARMGELADVELLVEPLAALCGVCADRGVSVGNPARAVGCGALVSFLRGSGWKGIVRRQSAGGELIFEASDGRG